MGSFEMIILRKSVIQAATVLIVSQSEKYPYRNKEELSVV